MAWTRDRQDTPKAALKVVEEFLRDFSWSEVSNDRVGDLHGRVVRLRELGDARMVWAFAETLKHPEITIRVLAAHWLLNLQPGCAEAPLAVQAINQALESGDEETRLQTLTLLGADAAPPKETIPQLERMLLEEDYRLRLGAAIALSQTASGAAKAIPVLTMACRADHPLVAVAGAAALARLGIKTSEAIKKLLEVLPGADPGIQLRIVTTFGQVGPAAVEAVPALLRLLETTTTNPAVRASTARILGIISRKNSVAVPALLRALEAQDWQVVLGSCYGLENSGGLPPTAVSTLIDLLRDTSADIRGTAALMLSEIGDAVVRAIPALLELLRSETDEDICWAAVKALVSARQAAVPGLIELLKTPTMRMRPLVAAALTAIGSEAVEEVVRTLGSHADGRVRQAAAWVVKGMGPRAVAAVPILLELLQEPRKEVRLAALVALSEIGPEAGAAATALSGALLDADPEVFEWAEKGLVAIGPEAMPTLHETWAAADGRGRERIGKVLARIGRAAPDRAADGKQSEFEKVGDDLLLELFAVVGELLLERPLSLEGIAKEFRRRRRKRMLRDGFPGSRSGIRKKLLKLESLLCTEQSGPLLHRPRNAKGSLTDLGRSVLPRVQAYLRAKARPPTKKS